MDSPPVYYLPEYRGDAFRTPDRKAHLASYRINSIIARYINGQDMYKRIDHENGQVEIQEYFRSPMVYLDHWALNDLALNKELRHKFIDIMARKGGTFRLSVFNILELSRQGDTSQVNSILEMIDSIPDCGLININPREVIKKENALISDPSLIFSIKNPSAELEIVTDYIISHNYPTSWHISNIIRNILPELYTKTSDSNNDFLRDIQLILGDGRANGGHLHKAKRRFRKLKNEGPQYQTSTSELLTMALDFLMINTKMKMSQYNEWVDIFHVIVPVSYCDIVMIDKRWKSFVTQTGYSFPKIAMVYDKKASSHLFKAIETWAY